MANQIQLNHKRLASGLFHDGSVEGDSTWVDPGWTGSPLYTSIAPSGADIKYLLFHNADSSNWIDTKIHFYGTGIDNRVLYISIPPDETAEWELDYVVHLESGESVYGSTSVIGGSMNTPLNYYIYGAEIVTGDLQGS